MSYRIERVNALLREEIGGVLAGELSDPRLSPMTSVTRVDVSRDLSFAKVYVSVLGNEKEKAEALQALKTASGFVHRAIRPNLRMRNVPRLAFYLDETIEKGAEMLALIDQVLEEDRARAAEAGRIETGSDDVS